MDFQASPRGGAEADFEALNLLINQFNLKVSKYPINQAYLGTGPWIDNIDCLIASLLPALLM